MATTGLFFGSFNPPHTGHLIIAEYFATRGGCTSVELVVSPQNPLKEDGDLAGEQHRLAMARLAVRGNPNIRVNAVEYALPRPSYTIDTLRYMARKRRKNTHALIMGSDILGQITQWKEWRAILDDYICLVYHRPGYPGSVWASHPNVRVITDVPVLHITASYIRQCVRERTSVRYLVQPAVERYIAAHRLYTTFL